MFDVLASQEVSPCHFVAVESGMDDHEIEWMEYVSVFFLSVHGTYVRVLRQ